VIDSVHGLVERIDITPISQAKGAPFNLAPVGRLTDLMEGKDTAGSL
jgi:hypothetical protein